MKKLFQISAILLFTASFPGYGENIRGPIKGISVIDNPAENIDEIELVSEDIFSLVLENSSSYPLKTVIELRLTEKLKEYRDVFALYFYNRIMPEPSVNNISYRGKLIDYKIIPSRSRHFIELHYSSTPDKNQILPGTDLIGHRKFQNEPFPLIISIQPVMKGVPAFLLQENFRVKFTHYWPDQGELHINVYEEVFENNSDTPSLKETSDYLINIDNNYYTAESFPITLSTGVKKIKIEKEGFIPFNKSVVINKNEKSNLDIILKDKTPYLRIFSPEEAEVFINGVLTEKREFTDLEEGQYTFVFKLGQYSLSRRITLENGKRYNLNLLLDIDFKTE